MSKEAARAYLHDGEIVGKPASEATAENLGAMLALVDELASLAADLWFAGKLDHFPLEEEPLDDE